MNALLQQIANAASADLARLIEEGSDDILKAIHKAEEEAQLQEAAPKFALGFKIAVDLDKSTFDCSLSWTIKQSLIVSHQIDDVNQPQLPIDDKCGDVKMEIHTGGKVVNLTSKQLADAAKRLAKNN